MDPLHCDQPSKQVTRVFTKATLCWHPAHFGTHEIDHVRKQIQQKVIETALLQLILTTLPRFEETI